MIYGIVIITLSFSLYFWLKLFDKLHIFENKKYYYTITFILDIIGFSLIFGGLSVIIPLFLLIMMFLYDRYIYKILNN